MPKQYLSFSVPTKFDLGTLEELREAAIRNQRSLSGEIRYRVMQTLKRPKDTDKNQSE